MYSQSGVVSITSPVLRKAPRCIGGTTNGPKHLNRLDSRDRCYGNCFVIVHRGGGQTFWNWGDICQSSGGREATQTKK